MNWLQWDKGSKWTGYSGREQIMSLVLVGYRINGLVTDTFYHLC